MIKEQVRSPSIFDVEHIIDHLRPEDEEEIRALDGSTAEQALAETPDLLENSQVWEVDGEVVCIFGVTPYEGKQGIIWMLATKNFDQYSMMFAARCKSVVAQMVSKYDYVFNYVYSENKRSIRWLKWLGFRVGKPEAIGIEGGNFHRFHMRNV
jgi:ribosomal protein S18 acetylase RimI-like enzyme